MHRERKERCRMVRRWLVLETKRRIISGYSAYAEVREMPSKRRLYHVCAQIVGRGQMPNLESPP